MAQGSVSASAHSVRQIGGNGKHKKRLHVLLFTFEPPFTTCRVTHAGLTMH